MTATVGPPGRGSPGVRAHRLSRRRAQRHRVGVRLHATPPTSSTLDAGAEHYGPLAHFLARAGVRPVRPRLLPLRSADAGCRVYDGEATERARRDARRARHAAHARRAAQKRANAGMRRAVIQWARSRSVSRRTHHDRRSRRGSRSPLLVRPSVVTSRAGTRPARASRRRNARHGADTGRRARTSRRSTMSMRAHRRSGAGG